jgi:hypothetical protein
MTPKWEKSMKTLTVIYFKPNPEHLDEYVERKERPESLPLYAVSNGPGHR